MKFRKGDWIMATWDANRSKLHIIEVLDVHAEMPGRMAGYTTKSLTTQTRITMTHNTDYIDRLYELASEDLKKLARILM